MRICGPGSGALTRVDIMSIGALVQRSRVFTFDLQLSSPPSRLCHPPFARLNPYPSRNDNLYDMCELRATSVHSFLVNEVEFLVVCALPSPSPPLLILLTSCFL